MQVKKTCDYGEYGEWRKEVLDSQMLRKYALQHQSETDRGTA